MTNEPYNYSNWNFHQPDNRNNEDYVHFLGHNNKWNDISNDYEYSTGYIVEYNTNPSGIMFNPDNGHYYELRYVPSSYTWDTVSISAERWTHNGVRGHLATITSQSENDFVANLVPNDTNAWIGLTDRVNEGEFNWVTGETFTYTNWDTSQPDNHNNNEDYVEFRGGSDKWNDINDDNGITSGYVIEYSGNLHNAVYNTDNGHYYRLVDAPAIAWTDAKTAAENHIYYGLNGHLVTITSQAENDFVADMLSHDLRAVWMGLSDADNEGVYRWVTNEPYNYTNWDPGEPDDFNHSEDYIQFLEYSDKWNDMSNYFTYGNGYIVEYSIP